MQEGVQRTRRVRYTDTGHCSEVAKPKCASCRRRKQHLQRGCGVAPTTCLEPIPVPHTHECTDGWGEEIATIIHDVCGRYCRATLWRQRCKHD